MVAGDGEERTIQVVLAFGRKFRDTFVGIPKVSQNLYLAVGYSSTDRIRLQDARIEAFLFHVHAVGRVKGAGHD